MTANRHSNAQVRKVNSQPLPPMLTRKDGFFGHDRCRSRMQAMAPVIDLNSARQRALNGRSYSQAEFREMAAGLNRLLEAIRVDEVTANAGTVARLEGAIAALEALAAGEDLSGFVP